VIAASAIPHLRTAVLVAWVVFWVYWMASAIGVKEGTRTGRTRPPGLLIVVLALLLLRVFGARDFAIEAPAVQAVGAVLLVAGLALAVWARIYLGRNWGMPMTKKDDPELVTSGPYQLVRHPIYSGILLAMLGTALASNVYWLIVLAIIGAYFVHSARVEEQLMADSFPSVYANYKARTKMLIPFVF
jgi:protein-S-isoprenylcysteine O-methyltransferase Ste14